MGYKKLSNEQEKQLVQEYVSGVPVKDLMVKYNFATKKSITDKVKKHYGENYKELIDLAKANRKGYHYTFEKINVHNYLLSSFYLISSWLVQFLLK